MTVYTCREVADVMKLEGKWAVKLVEKLCRQGKIRAFKPSNKEGWRIHEKAVEDCLLLLGD